MSYTIIRMFHSTLFFPNPKQPIIIFSLLDLFIFAAFFSVCHLHLLMGYNKQDLCNYLYDYRFTIRENVSLFIYILSWRLMLVHYRNRSWRCVNDNRKASSISFIPSFSFLYFWSRFFLSFFSTYDQQLVLMREYADLFLYINRTLDQHPLKNNVYIYVWVVWERWWSEQRKVRNVNNFCSGWFFSQLSITLQQFLLWEFNNFFSIFHTCCFVF